MSSFLRKVRRRKKSRTLGEVQVVDRERYEDLGLDAKVALIQELVPLGVMSTWRYSWTGRPSPMT